MNSITRNTKTIVAFLMLIFLFSGCQLFTAAQKKLSAYCPGLKIEINGISWSSSGGRSIYMINYDSNAQKQIKDYFENKEHGFSDAKNGDFYGIEQDDSPVIDRNDNILWKSIAKTKVKAEVIFNQSTRRIIIVEEPK